MKPNYIIGKIILFLLAFTFACDCPDNSRDVELTSEQKDWFTAPLGGDKGGTMFFNNGSSVIFNYNYFTNSEESDAVDAEYVRCKPVYNFQTRYYNLWKYYEFEHRFEVRAKEQNKLYFFISNSSGGNWARGFAYINVEQPLEILENEVMVDKTNSFFKYIGDSIVYGTPYSDIYQLEVAYKNQGFNHRFLISKAKGIVFLIGSKNENFHK